MVPLSGVTSVVPVSAVLEAVSVELVVSPKVLLLLFPLPSVSLLAHATSNVIMVSTVSDRIIFRIFCFLNGNLGEIFRGLYAPSQRT